MLPAAASSTSRRCTTLLSLARWPVRCRCLLQGAMHGFTVVHPGQRCGDPHLGASTDEAQEKAGVAVAKSVRQALAGELVPDAVNVEGGNIEEAVRPFIELTERVGRIASTLAPSPIAAVDVQVLGEAATADVRVLQLSALKGVFSRTC